MSVILRKKKNKDGSTSLYLDIYSDGKRKYEFLKNLKLSKPSNPADRIANSESFRLAKQIAIKRAHELSAGDYGLISESGKKTIVCDWMQLFVDDYRKRDKRNMQGVLNRFKDFLLTKKLQGLTFGRLSETLIEDFRDFLKDGCKGEGAASYFSRFKKMIKQAVRKKLILNNPAAEVKRPPAVPRKKDILTLDEIRILSATQTESSEVKRAFLFTCMTGRRWIEIKNLTWANINLKTGTMTIEQTKVDGTSKEVIINLNDTALKLIGKSNNPDEYVFSLPTANGANKTLKAWVKRAGIGKKITWHNGRHSFGTNLIVNKTDLITTSRLMGHSTTKHTERYVKTARELMERATDSLNFQYSEE